MSRPAGSDGEKQGSWMVEAPVCACDDPCSLSRQGKYFDRSRDGFVNHPNSIQEEIRVNQVNTTLFEKNFLSI